MIDSFFGVHPFVFRSGIWKQMKPGEKDLYLYLMEESERRCTRKIRATDAEIFLLVGAASRTLCNARKKLQELGLIRYDSGQGNRYTYEICDPKTCKPYPGDPRAPMVVPKKNRMSEQGRRQASGDTLRKLAPEPQRSSPRKQFAVEAHGVPLTF